MKASKKFLKIELFKKVLETLYEAYPDPVWVRELSKSNIEKKSSKEIRATYLYLEDKDLIVGSGDKWRITALGIDFLEQRNLLKVEPAKPDVFVINKEN